MSKSARLLSLTEDSQKISHSRKPPGPETNAPRSSFRGVHRSHRPHKPNHVSLRLIFSAWFSLLGTRLFIFRVPNDRTERRGRPMGFELAKRRSQPASAPVILLGTIMHS